MDLIYYWPSNPMRVGEAPEKVGRNILKYIANCQNKIPFTLKVLVDNFSVNMQEIPNDTNTITLLEFKNFMTKSILHIPLSPWMMDKTLLLTRLHASMKGVPIISNCHGEPYNHHYKQYIKDRDFLRVVRLIPAVYIFAPILFRNNYWLIAHSPIMKNMLMDRYGTSIPITIIPNGIEEWWFNAKVPQIELDGEPSIFYHGRLSYEKGLMPLIEAFSKIKKKTKCEAKLYLAGSGPLEKRLKNMCEKFNIESDVFFLGKLNREEIKMYLQLCDAAIYPSLFESFPLSYLEALSSAKGQCYFSNIGTQGILYFASDEEKKILNLFEPTVEGIAPILENIVSYTVENKSKKQKEFARKFLWEKVIDYYINLYNKIYEELNG